MNKQEQQDKLQQEKEQWISLFSRFLYKETLYFDSRSKNEQLNRVRKCLRVKADPNFVIDKEGNTIMHACANLGRTDFMLEFLASGGDINIPNKAGQTPLYAALMMQAKKPEAKKQRLKMIRLLLEFGADPNSRINEHDDRIMHACAILGDTEVMTLLLEFKGDVNVPNKFAQRPYREIFNNPTTNKKLKNLLLKNKADVFARDYAGDSDFFFMTPDEEKFHLRNMIPESRFWSEEQKITKIGFLKLADYAAVSDMHHFTNHEPPPTKMVDAMMVLNEVKNRAGKFERFRPPSEALYNVDDMYAQIVGTTIVPRAIHRYPKVNGPLDLKGYLGSTYTFLPRRNSYFPDEQVLMTCFKKQVMHENCKPGINNNDFSSLAAHRRVLFPLKMEARYRYNASAIYSDISDYQYIKFDSMFDGPVEHNGLYFLPMDNSDMIFNDFHENQTCIIGQKKNAIGSHVYLVKITTDIKNDPGYTAGFTMVNTGKDASGNLKYRNVVVSAPLGYMDNPAPQNVNEGFDWIRHSIMSGKFGDPHARHAANRERGHARVKLYHPIDLMTGFNVGDENSLNKAELADRVFAFRMDKFWKPFDPNPIIDRTMPIFGLSPLTNGPNL